MADRGRILSGPRARFGIEGLPFSFATGVNGGEECQHEGIEVIDNIETQEFVPVATRCTLDAAKVWFVNETFKSLGWFPKNGTNPGEHLRNALNIKDLNAVVQDTFEEKAFQSYDGLRMAGYNWAITPRAVVGTNCNFVAIRVRDVSEV